MERGDLQRLQREQIEIIALGALVIAEEYGDWEDGRHMELQSIRYAVMISGNEIRRCRSRI